MKLFSLYSVYGFEIMTSEKYDNHSRIRRDTDSDDEIVGSSEESAPLNVSNSLWKFLVEDSDSIVFRNESDDEAATNHL